MIYRVFYKSKYYPFEETLSIKVNAVSKESIKDNWYDIISTDEYKIVKIEEVKEG